MEGLRIEADLSGTVIKTMERGSYETGNSGAWKTWYASPHASTKVGEKKGRSYTSTYTPMVHRNRTTEIKIIKHPH